MVQIDLIEALHRQINFCQEKGNYKCGVYVRTQERRKIVMEVISNLIPRPNRDIELRLGSCCAEARFRNGNILKIINVNDGARANRLNGLIIDNDIEKNIINCIIMPTLVSCLSEETKMRDPNDNPMDRVYYVDISYDDIVKSEKYKQPILYVSSSNDNSNGWYKYQKDVLDVMSYSIQVKDNKDRFEKEYECMFYENDYDRPVVEKELNGDKVMLYEAWGIPKEVITYSTEFINKTKQTYLNIVGKHENETIGFENSINVHLRIDTDIYDGYEVHIEDGLITVVFHEIKNEAPVLKDYGAV